MAVTKLDDELREKIEKFIERGNNRFDYPSVKAFVDKAVLKLLQHERKR